MFARQDIIKVLSTVFMMSAIAACGKLDVKTPAKQVEPDLQNPIPDGNGSSLGLTAERQDLNFVGTLILFQNGISPEKIADISNASTDRRRVENSIVGRITDIRNDVVKAYSAVDEKREEQNRLQAEENAARQRRWLENSTYVYKQIDSLTVPDEAKDRAKTIFNKYCEAMVWDLVLGSRIFLNNQFSEVPTPLIFCSQFYAENGILYDPSSIDEETGMIVELKPLPGCERADNGELRDYFDCLVTNGIAKTSFFRNLYSPTSQARMLEIMTGQLPAGLEYYKDTFPNQPGKDTFRQVLSDPTLGKAFLNGGVRARRVYQLGGKHYCCAYKDQLNKSDYDATLNAEYEALPEGLDGMNPQDVIDSTPAQNNQITTLFPSYQTDPSFTASDRETISQTIDFIDKIAKRSQGISTADVVTIFDNSYLGQLSPDDSGYIRGEDFFKDALARKEIAATYLPGFFDDSQVDSGVIKAKEELQALIAAADEKASTARSLVSPIKSELVTLIEEIVSLPRNPEVSAAFYGSTSMEITQNEKIWQVRFKLSTKAPIMQHCFNSSDFTTASCPKREGDENLEFSTLEPRWAFNPTTGRLSMTFENFQNPDLIGFQFSQETPSSEFYNHLDQEAYQGKTLELEFFVSEMPNLSVMTGGIYFLDAMARRPIDGGISLSDCNERIVALEKEIYR